MTRIEKVLAKAQVAAHEGVIIHKPSNIFYLSGYTGEGILVFGHGFKAIITDFRYTEQAENQASGFQVLMVGKGLSHVMLAKKVFDENAVTAAYFEDDEINVRAFRKMEEVLNGITLSPINNVPEQVRRIKDEGEIAAIEEACNISCQAFEALLPHIKPRHYRKAAADHSG
ncbi:MAG: aminopeptidase P family N-terminal domain-containing protein [Clostridia bacterium]|nr:aminopeptidase P family N-terminal domain-containing protein [Clostridia bacterium]